MMYRSSSMIPIPKSNTPRSNINQRSSNNEVAKYNDIRMYELIVSGMLEQMKRQQCTNGTVHPMSEKSLRGILRTSLTRYEELEPSYFDDDNKQQPQQQQQPKQQCRQDQDETKQDDDNDWISFSVDSSWEKEVSCINFDAKTSIDSIKNNYCLYSKTSEDSNDSTSITRRSESSICESMMQLPSIGEDEERHGDDCNDCVFILEL